MSEWVKTREIKKAFLFHDLRLDTEYDIFRLTGSYVWKNITVFYNIDSYEIPFTKDSLIIDVKPMIGTVDGGLPVWAVPQYDDNTVPNVDMNVSYSIRGGRYITFYVNGATKVSKPSVRITCLFTEGD